MTDQQLRLLAKMKRLVYKGYKKFEDRSDRDNIQDLLDIGISLDEAWKEVLLLSKADYYFDLKPTYAKTGESLTFRKIINGVLVYIKLKIETYNNNETTTCISFHISNK